MATSAATTMSTKGQVVIHEEIRARSHSEGHHQDAWATVRHVLDANVVMMSGCCSAA
jgi:hypothetical protein